MKKPRITFDSGAREFILGAFGKTVKDGFVIHARGPARGERVLTPRGEEVPVAEFAGVRRGPAGSVIVIKSDVTSLVEAAEAIGA